MLISYCIANSLSDHMRNDIGWFAKTDLSKYKGQYIAIVNKKVVASGINAKTVWKAAERKYPNKKSTIAKILNNETFVLNIGFGVAINGRISLQKRKL